MSQQVGEASGLRRRCAALVLAGGLLAGCASGPDGARTREPAFYPPPPQPPRIQHLVTLSGARDLEPPPGAFARFILGEGSESEQLQRPYGAALFGSKLYVADSRTPGLAVFDFERKGFAWVTGSGRGRMKRPINVTIDTDGTKYVTDTGRDQILVYDRDDAFVTAYGAPGQFRPVDTAIAGERLYVADIQNSRIHVLDKRSGDMMFSFGKPGHGPGELFQPTNLAIDDRGDVYVVETGNFRIQRFTAQGQSVRTYGRVGSAPGSFARPKGIALDRDGRMYVSDAAFQNVQIFDREGRLLLYFGQPDDGGPGLSLPAGVSISYQHVPLFRSYADPNFDLEYVVLVASQFGPNQIDVFGFGRMQGQTYPAEAAAAGGRPN